MKLDAVIKGVKVGKEKRFKGRAMALSNIQSCLDVEGPAMESEEQ